jgi:hypothetical protein
MSSTSSDIAKVAILSKLFEKAIFAKSVPELIYDALPTISNFISGYLDNSQNSPHFKLSLILSVFSKLKRLMEIPLWKNHLSSAGSEINFVIICRNIVFCAHSLPALIEQSAYAAALLEFPSSGFPLLLADLPIFLKANLLDEYETLKEEASKAAAAAEEAKLELERLAFKATFDKYLAEVPAEHLPALEEGRRLQREWWNGSVSSKMTFTKEQLELLKSYKEFTSFVQKKMNGN